MANLHPTAWVAPGAYLRGDVTLGEQTNVWYNAVLRADQEKITIGAFSNVQDNCVLHGDAGNHVTVGDHVTVGHGAILHGCTVGDNTLIGMGAIVLNGAKIGSDCIVGRHRQRLHRRGRGRCCGGDHRAAQKPGGRHPRQVLSPSGCL